MTGCHTAETWAHHRLSPRKVNMYKWRQRSRRQLLHIFHTITQPVIQAMDLVAVPITHPVLQAMQWVTVLVTQPVIQAMYLVAVPITHSVWQAIE